MTAKTTTKKTATSKPRKTRSATERVAELEAEIERVRQREATRELRSDPAVKATSAAVRALNKALAEASDPELVEALTAAHGALAGWLEAKGLRVPKPGKKRGQSNAA